jgi:hypothetical protein
LKVHAHLRLQLRGIKEGLAVLITAAAALATTMEGTILMP